ncbi:hypothetical protein AB4K20DRAFT_1885641 [Rhizopus microsporus]
MPDKIFFFVLTIPQNVSIAVFFLCTGSHLSCGLKIKVISLSFMIAVLFIQGKGIMTWK